MPIIAYECLKCRSRFERVEPDGESAPAGCPACGGKVARLGEVVGPISRAEMEHSDPHRLVRVDVGQGKGKD